MLSLGETGELSPNASAMLRISTLSAWAQLQISSVSQPYLQQVVQPFRPTLASLWISSLRDYASIRVDSEFLQDTSSVSLDSSYSSLGKEVLLPVCGTLFRVNCTHGFPSTSQGHGRSFCLLWQVSWKRKTHMFSLPWTDENLPPVTNLPQLTPTTPNLPPSSTSFSASSTRLCQPHRKTRRAVPNASPMLPQPYGL